MASGGWDWGCGQWWVGLRGEWEGLVVGGTGEVSLRWLDMGGARCMGGARRGAGGGWDWRVSGRS